MNKWSVIRELTIIFSFIFTLSIIFALLTGANLTNENVFSILIFSLIVGVGCSIFYIDSLVDLLGIFWIQVAYILLIFTAFFICSKLFCLECSTDDHGICFPCYNSRLFYREGHFIQC